MNEPRLVTKVVSQGGVLSPLLFNIYVKKIAEGILDSVCVSQFAYNLAIYFSNDPLIQCTETIQISRDIIEENLKKIELELNV